VANTATVRVSLRIDSDDFQPYHQSQPTAFQADIGTVMGPTPGAISVSLSGTDVDLSQLAVPGLCTLTNLDSTNYVTYGVLDPTTGYFYPFGELLPGEVNLVRLSRQFGEEFVGTVTGTGTDAINNVLHLRANGAACNVRIEAFNA
jgi:hypothetical protein